MNLKYGKALVGALAAVTLSAFTVPFGATASASTGTTITRNDASSAMQLAQVEQQETAEKTEQKTKVKIHRRYGSRPPGRRCPGGVCPEVAGKSSKKHEESKTTESCEFGEWRWAWA